jgi:hypothetical protein
MWSRSRRISAAEDGFSLVELVTVTGLLLLVITTLMSMLTIIQRSEARQASRSYTNDITRIAMERITKEIRQASSVAAGATASSLTISTYVQGVAATVTYTASGTTLTRLSGGTTSLLIDRLTSTSVFSYDPSATDPSTIQISLRVQPESFVTDPNSVVELDSEVQLRN